MALPAIDPTIAPTAMEPTVPIMPEPAAAGAAAVGVAAGVAGAAGAGAGAAAAGDFAGAGACAGADVRGAGFVPPMRLACASEGSASEATARVTTERLVRKETFMKPLG